MKNFDSFGLSRLLALHGCDDDLVASGQLFEVSVLVSFHFTGFEALCEKVISDCFLDRLRVRFLIAHPTSKLMCVFCCGFWSSRELDDLFGGFLNGDPVGVHFTEDIVVIVNPARDLAVSRNLSWEKGEEG